MICLSKKYSWLVLAVFLLVSCSNGGTKKAKQWNTYKEMDFVIEHSAESNIESVPSEGEGNVWFNIHYPDLDATIHCSYLPIDSLTLKGVLADAKRLAYQQKPQSSHMREERVEDGVTINSGLIYVLSGKASTPLQFYVTDNKRHFLRGSLYIAANADIEFDSKLIESIKEDITHLITSIRWID